MHFTPKEQDKLTLLCVGLIAERRLKKGLKLNYPETVAYITSHALEGAREGKTVEEVMHDAANLLTKEQVMEIMVKCYSDGIVRNVIATLSR